MTPENAAVGGAPFRGPVPTIYDGNKGAAVGFHAALPMLKRARPEAIQLHTWEITTAAKAVRTAFPDVRLIAGFGVDGIARKVSEGRITTAQAASEFVKLADSAVRVGCIAVVWNAEVAYKTLDATIRARLVAAIRAGLAAVAEKYPELRQLHTSYDHPTYHSAYPWEAWLGGSTPILASLPQVYAAPANELRAARGALPAREARALSSWALAVRRGWIKPDAAEGAAADMTDVDWLPYYQLHHGALPDMIAGLVRYPVTFAWAMPTRIDPDGELAFLAASALHRLGYTGPEAVRTFQAAFALKGVDNIAGRGETVPALLRELDAMNAQGKGLAQP